MNSRLRPSERYLRAAEKWAVAQEASNTRAANRVHDRELIPALKAASQDAEEVERIVARVENANPGVRLWAACFALRHNRVKAERALARLSKLPNLWAGFSAELTLREWKKGTLEPGAWER